MTAPIDGRAPADNSSQLDGLLVLQEHDVALDRLRHRRATLPERDVLARGVADLQALVALIDETRAQRDEVAREEGALDDEARTLQAKGNEVEAKMYSGEISSPRELQSMQADVEQLRRHQRTIENRELELMEAREPLDAQLAELEQRRDTLVAELDHTRQELAGIEAEIDAEAQEELTARVAIADTFDAALITVYERCRALARGVGAARLVGNTCQGCHLSIPATEVDRIKKTPPGTIAHCDNCGCILVP